MHDTLTGLANRMLLMDRLRAAVAVARRKHKRFGVFFLDLDGLKPSNDEFGNKGGDLVRESDTVARIGGDEFVMLLDDLEDDRAIASVAERLPTVPCTRPSAAARTATAWRGLRRRANLGPCGGFDEISSRGYNPPLCGIAPCGCCCENGQVAQLVEQRTENPCVGGSIPPLATKIQRPTVLSWAFSFVLPA